MVQHDLGFIRANASLKNDSDCEKNGMFSLFSRKAHFLYSNTNCILKKVINQKVSKGYNIETTAAHIPKFHDIDSHRLWKYLGFFLGIF